jgi:DNA ligase-associated metallophosphoesterase
MKDIEIKGNHLQLHLQKAIYWPAEQALLLSDLHLGKEAHFRRAGIAVPLVVADVNFSRLRELIMDCRPARVLFLGDLFHSDYNHVWALFCAFLEDFPSISFELVPGNHDILTPAAYAASRLLLQPEVVLINNLSLSHHPLTDSERPAGSYNLYGHIHPCVALRDAAGNRIRLPAFFFGQTGAILPAFGEFTGCVEVKARAGDRVFVLAGESIIEVN